ncbi:FAD-linked oxidoreductase [Mycena belliarum]|uniref:Proline dehydrogenase n=1 Tax=Mycena belliarum TaxID=1033014 RepID=A0AAD6XIN8_9AGAR|nr:FAD-linked oxidoreductase [Mycena belliae]
MCSLPPLVDHAPWLLDTLARIPGLRSLTEALVRITFFDQFVGGDSAEETLPVLRALRSGNVGTLFAYSVEVDEAEATTASSDASANGGQTPEAIVEEMIHCIDVAADFEDRLQDGEGSGGPSGRRTWVAVKLTALLPDAGALIRLSSHILAARTRSDVPFPGTPSSSDLNVLWARSPTTPLTRADIDALRALHVSLNRICARAAQRGVRIIIDAEYSWYQPAIDAYAEGLMREFNALRGSHGAQTQPLVYTTFQAYLRRTPAHIAHALHDARAGGYALGAKLVRGAYHPHEVAAHHAASAPAPASAGPSPSISPEAHPPVWATKRETDAAYDACAAALLDAVAADVAGARGTDARAPSVGLLFGTHNWASCRRILDGMERRGLAARVRAHTGTQPDEGVLRVDRVVGERVSFGQLYGMCADLTQYLAARTESAAPMVIKYVPYGALSETLPYLARRAIENKTVLGGGAAARERARAGELIWGKIFGRG